MNDKPVFVLGGGVAGLAAAYYLRRAGVPIQVLEGSGILGGNARTLAHGDFRFDSGAHRFHDWDPDVTADVRALLGDDLVEVRAPSRIRWRGRWIDFPLTPASLVRSLGLVTLTRAVLELAAARLSAPAALDTFESVAVRRYGRTISDLFLLGYARKLWGVPCHTLDPSVSGERLHGLTLTSLLRDLIRRPKRESTRFERRFWYPTRGIGAIADRLADECGRDRIRLNSRLSKIEHDGRRIVAIEINGQERLDTRDTDVVGTLPIGVLVSLCSPALPPAVVDAARSLRFRHIVLVTLFVNRPSVTANATIYAPDTGVPFTRIAEPRNRSPLMAPPGKTSLSIEIPCWSADAVWRADDATLLRQCLDGVVAMGLLDADDYLDGVVHRLPNAYPVLEIGSADQIATVRTHLAAFENLHMTGRAGRFAYVHVHDLMRAGRELADRLAAR